MSDNLKPCPWCKGAPRVDREKVRHCSLHGEPSQAVRVYCYHHRCPAQPAVVGGDILNGGFDRARQVAVALWNSRPSEEALADETDALAAALAAARARVAELEARIDAAAEMAESIIAAPHLPLWNHGSRPTRLEKAQVAGRKEAAQDILVWLDDARARAALNHAAPEGERDE